VLKVKPTGLCGRTATRGGRNGNEAITGATSEAFTRWLHHWYAPVELPFARYTIPCLGRVQYCIHMGQKVTDVHNMFMLGDRLSGA